MNETTRSRLLIVDDEPGMRRTLARIMKAKGFEVQVATDGESAVSLCREFHPDMLLMDIRMPGMDGVEAWRQIRDVCPDAYVIFMTAYASDERTSEARSAGALDVVSKPLDIDGVCRVINRTGRPVLLIDDDPGFRDSLERALKQSAFRVTSAANADEALQYFDANPLSIVLLDMKLNETTGLEVLKSIQSRAENVLVILMTGFEELAGDVQQGLSFGAVASFTKPFDVDDLVSEIHRILEQ